eukprot:GGOE01061707.1.p1 GENE.GGOE01061707.1~~GGOE01061707.1.p1  ORF type:complete len:373 (-),score=89.48 GGOE01061707.1:272-1309(-)
MAALAWVLLCALLPVVGGSALHICSNAEADRVRDSMGDITQASSCPEAIWKPLFQSSRTLQALERPVVIFDIGCNKGYDAVKSLRLFSQDPRFDVMTWGRETRFRCGVCAQCKTNPRLEAGTASKTVHLHCIEPLPANYETVQAAADRLGLRPRGLRVVHGAFTNRSDAVARKWRAQFPVVRGWWALLPTSWKLFGAEQVGIDVNPLCPGCAMEDVPLMVLDDYVVRENISRIDVLSLDTEGNDALVLQGGARTLASCVGYVEFEYGTGGAWQHIRLPEVLLPLEEAGFVCYWLGKGKLWRITGCWHAAYSTVQVWANIGCVHRRETEWSAIMELIFQGTMRPTN